MKICLRTVAACASLLSLLVASCVTAPIREVSLPAHQRESACLAVSTTGTSADEIIRLERRGAQVNVDGWSIEEARGFFAPDFVSVQPGGQVNGVDTVFASFVDGRSQPWASSFELVELDVRVINCDTAIVIGLAEVRPANLPAEAAPVRLRFLNVWRKHDDRWLYAANQWTRAQSTPPSTQ